VDRSFFRFVTIHAFDRRPAFSSLDRVCIRVARFLTRPTGRGSVGSSQKIKDARDGSGQEGLRTQIWRHEIELVIKCCLVCLSCHIWLLYIIRVYTCICGWHDCWRNAISIRIRVKLSPQWHDCLNCSLY